jgi:hypothetical protein
VRSTDPPDEDEEAVEDAVLELFAPSLAHATANNMRAANLKALIERLLLCFLIVFFEEGHYWYRKNRSAPGRSRQRSGNDIVTTAPGAPVLLV